MVKVNQDSHSSNSSKNQMIAVLRIVGRATIKKVVKETLTRLRLGKKLTCVLIEENDKIRMGMVKSVSDYVAFGKIDDKTIKELEKRKKVSRTGKEYFALHPPIGGFKKSTKASFSSKKGILGKWKDNELDKLLLRMI